MAQRSGISRRGFLGALGLGAAALGNLFGGVASARKASGKPGLTFDQATVPVDGVFSLPALPYDFGALEPLIDSETMYIHHQKHHGTYVTRLNAALADYPKLRDKSVAELLWSLNTLPSSIQTAVRNNGGGHVNHSIFWAIMAPGAGGKPGGKLAEAIAAAFGSFDSFKTQFNDAAAARFGSGWAWLSVDGSGALRLASYANQDSPYLDGMTPLIGVDVWEHAYYLKYRQKRAEYLAAWWGTVNWGEVGRRYDLARGA